MRRRVVAAGVVLAALFMPLWILSASASKKLRSARISSGVRAVLRGERAVRQVVRGRRAVESRLPEAPILREAPGAGREVALTFDDGPGPFTDEILDILIRHRAPATFFPVGLAIEEYPDEIRREARAGFAIGDHTQDHVKMAGLPRPNRNRSCSTRPPAWGTSGRASRASSGRRSASTTPTH